MWRTTTESGSPGCARATSVTGSPPIGLSQSAGGDSPPGRRARNRARPEPSATSCVWRAILSAGSGDELDRDRVGILACRKNGKVHVLVEVQERHARRVMADSTAELVGSAWTGDRVHVTGYCAGRRDRLPSSLSISRVSRTPAAMPIRTAGVMFSIGSPRKKTSYEIVRHQRQVGVSPPNGRSSFPAGRRSLWIPGRPWRASFTACVSRGQHERAEASNYVFVPCAGERRQLLGVACPSRFCSRSEPRRRREASARGQVGGNRSLLHLAAGRRSASEQPVSSRTRSYSTHHSFAGSGTVYLRLLPTHPRSSSRRESTP
jgi:hypothetical protein